jgi:hypothetical protein
MNHRTYQNMYGNAVRLYVGRPDNLKQSDAGFAGAVVAGP